MNTGAMNHDKPSSRKAQKEVSVVIVSKNEEKHIAECIESVLEAVREYTSEVLLVDSASSDNTVKIASRYPIKILGLRDNWLHSAAAGRYVGFRASEGDRICFLDADTKLSPAWLPQALEVLKEDDIAGVAGLIENHFDDKGGSKLVRRRILTGFQRLSAGDTDVLGGPAMFKRSALEETGGYHPFLIAGEEADLSARLRAKGYRLVRTGSTMVEHYGECPSLLSFLRKYQWNYVVAVGRSIRYALRRRDGSFRARWQVLLGSFFVLLILSYLLVSVGMFVGFGLTYPLIAGIAAYGILYVASIVLRKSLSDAMLSLLIVNIRAVAFFIGFAKGLPDPAEYPDDPILIKGT